MGTIENKCDGLTIEIKSTQIKLVKRILKIIKNVFPNTIIETRVITGRNFNQKQKVYKLSIVSNVKEILFNLKLIDNIDVKNIFFLNKLNIIEIKEKEKSLYSKIFFCCCGSINDPKKAQQYHLEIVLNNTDYLKEIANITKKYNINFKLTKRKHNNAIYLNKSEEIADFMKFINCKDTLFEFENERIQRDIFSMSNRLNNAEISNEMKRLDLSIKQIEAIEYLKVHHHFDQMNEKTKKIAELRTNHSELSLQEIADTTNGEISKSNVRYHLNNIVKLYNIINKENNE